MSDFKEFLNENLEKDPEFKEIWEENSARRELAKKIIELRIKEKINQKELAERIGTNQSAISRFESGNYNPTVDFLCRLARNRAILYNRNRYYCHESR